MSRWGRWAALGWAGLVGWAVLAMAANGVVDCTTRYWQDAETRRLAEYWTGREQTGGALIVRSHANERAGLYFSLLLEKPLSSNLAGAVLMAEVIRTGDRQPVEFRWTLPALDHPVRMVRAGITGPDWPSAEIKPLAWRLRLTEPNGAVLFEYKSFLWEMP